MQAVFRKMGLDAIKGDRFAQKTLTGLVKQVENAHAATRSDYVETMIELKNQSEQAIKQALARGLPEPELLHHPDDIFIDRKTGSVHICGPFTKEEKAKWNKRFARRDEAQAEVSENADRHRRARDPRHKEVCLSLLHSEQLIFDTINDKLPLRYRTEFKDRSWEEGASGPGSQKKEPWPGE